MNNKEALKYLKEALSDKKYHLKDLEEEAEIVRQDINFINHMINLMKASQDKDSKPKPSTKKISEKT